MRKATASNDLAVSLRVCWVRRREPARERDAALLIGAVLQMAERQIHEQSHVIRHDAIVARDDRGGASARARGLVACMRRWQQQAITPKAAIADAGIAWLFGAIVAGGAATSTSKRRGKGKTAPESNDPGAV
jgi:hypothetical protein